MDREGLSSLEYKTTNIINCPKDYCKYFLETDLVLKTSLCSMCIDVRINKLVNFKNIEGH